MKTALQNANCREQIKNFLYTRTAVAYVLGIPQEKAGLIQIEVWAYVILAHSKVLGFSRFVSKRKVLAAFAEMRREKAKAYNAIPVDYPRKQWKVVKPNKRIRTVTIVGATVQCDCPDYANIKNYLGRGVCKHGYAVLSRLGFHTLSDFEQAIKRITATKAS